MLSQSHNKGTRTTSVGAFVYFRILTDINNYLAISAS